jgi:anti-sigma B factor antagonist
MSTDPMPAYTSPVPAEAFRCDVSPERDAVRVLPVGELDMATVSSLEAQVDELREAGFRRIVIDLRGLRFIDSSGLHCLLRCDEQARERGASLQLVRASPPVQRVFELSGLSERLPFVDA